MRIPFTRRIVKIRRRWPFVVTWLMPPSRGWWYRHFVEDVDYARKDRR